MFQNDLVENSMVYALNYGGASVRGYNNNVKRLATTTVSKNEGGWVIQSSMKREESFSGGYQNLNRACHCITAGSSYLVFLSFSLSCAVFTLGPHRERPLPSTSVYFP
jgi:hypothetical protein